MEPNPEPAGDHLEATGEGNESRPHIGGQIGQSTSPGSIPRSQGGKKNTSATITIASLNMRGWGDVSVDTPNSKWWHVNQLMRDKRIGILAIQEAHLNEDLVDRLHNIFGRQLKIMYSALENNYNAAGVALVINKDVTVSNEIACQVVIPGRALALFTTWHQGETMCILNVYAPNLMNENKTFWNELDTSLQSMNIKPDLVLGDFNLVTAESDRFPPRPDNQGAVMALNHIIGRLGLIDGWRNTYSTTRNYSYYQKATEACSRIDRIYGRKEINQYSSNWEISHSPIGSDHQMVSVKVAAPHLPVTGRGRWTMPPHILKDKTTMNKITLLGVKMVEEIASMNERTDDRNPQTIFKKFKDQVITTVRNRAQVLVPMLEAKIKKLEAQLVSEMNKEEANRDQNVAAATIEEKIQILEERRHQQVRYTTAAMNRIHGETVSKYWAALNKAK
ncbi:DNase I-like protein, partial [Pleurotus eryngii]